MDHRPATERLNGNPRFHYPRHQVSAAQLAFGGPPDSEQCSLVVEQDGVRLASSDRNHPHGLQQSFARIAAMRWERPRAGVAAASLGHELGTEALLGPALLVVLPVVPELKQVHRKVLGPGEISRGQRFDHRYELLRNCGRFFF